MNDIFQVVNIETCNICNRSCSFCKFGQPKFKESKSFLEFELIEKIAKELVELNFKGRTHFTGINEPLLDSRVYAMLKLFQNLKGDKSITTNGDYLNYDTLQKLSDSGLTHINISIYSDNHLKSIKKKCEGWNYGLSDMRPNTRRLSKVLVNRAGDINLENIIDSRIIQIKNMNVNKNCVLPSTYIVINSQGFVCLCPEEMYGLSKMGDIRKNSLLEIWNFDKFKHYRETLRKEGRKNLEFCKNCNVSGQKNMGEKGKELFKL